ncbi:MAG TPA: DUF2793 domain-containing protein [Allosphingosinicella sp.]|jgi:hypothetical protein
MDESSPRLALPFILPGQAQKEHFHNEALLRIDTLLCAAAEGAEAEPPAAPAPGAAWIVTAPAVGAWNGRENQVAVWSSGGWRFIAPTDGLAVWNKAQGVEWRWAEGGWAVGALKGSALFIGGQQVVGERLPAVPSPSGGTIIDAEARSAVDQIIVALMQHGLIE